MKKVGRKSEKRICKKEPGKICKKEPGKMVDKKRWDFYSIQILDEYAKGADEEQYRMPSSQRGPFHSWKTDRVWITGRQLRSWDGEQDRKKTRGFPERVFVSNHLRFAHVTGSETKIRWYRGSFRPFHAEHGKGFLFFKKIHYFCDEKSRKNFPSERIHRRRKVWQKN